MASLDQRFARRSFLSGSMVVLGSTLLHASRSKAAIAASELDFVPALTAARAIASGAARRPPDTIARNARRRTTGSPDPPAPGATAGL